MIRIFNWFATILLLTISLTSCCHKKDCGDEVYIMNAIQVYNYSQPQLDSIIIYTFPRNSGFKNPLDSTIISASNPYHNNNYYEVYNNYCYDMDYQLKIVKTGDVFNIGLLSVRQICNSCIVGNDYYQELVGYSVNGEVKSGSIIKINN